jgi:hypothetical protein
VDVINIVDVIIGSGILILLFLVLWLKERRNSRNEYIAYGLRSSEDQTENTKTNITGLEGQWRWVKSGIPVGELLKKNG